MSEVDVIDLLRPCETVRLYYIFGDQGDSGDVQPVTVRITQAVVYGPWVARSPSVVTDEIQTELKQEYSDDVSSFGSKVAQRLLPDAENYSLPYPGSYWHVYVVHNDNLALSLGGVRCIRS